MEKTRTGKYFACILYEETARAPEPVVPTEDTTLGLKYSMRHFYAASDGALADPPQWRKQSQEKLAAVQRRLSRMRPGSRKDRKSVV